MALPADRRRRVFGARQRVVHERAGDELALAVVLRVLHQALADALHHAAVDLSLHQQRVHDRAEVVHRAVAHHLHHAGLGIDLDLAHVAAVGEGRWNHFSHMRHIELFRVFFRQLRNADGPVGPRHHEPSCAELDVRRRGLERLAGQFLSFLDDKVRGLRDRRAAHHHRARAAGAGAEHELVGVALHEADAFERHAKARREHLRERRRVPLPIVERPRNQLDTAIPLKGNAPHFLVRRRRHLEVAADPEPAQLSPFFRFCFSKLEVLHVSSLKGFFENLSKIPAVVRHPRGGLVRDLLRPHVVAPAQLEPVDPHLARCRVDQALHVVVRLRPTCAAISAHRRGVGEHHLRRHLEERRAVHAGDVAHHVHRRRLRRHRAEVRADVAVAGDAHGEEPAFLIQGELSRHLVVAAVLVGQE